MSSVCVHGLGYVGLPTAAMLAAHGYETAGYDIDADLRTRLKKGDIDFEELALQSLVENAVSSEKFEVVDEPSPAEYHLICVPTPYVPETKQTDLSYVGEAALSIASILRPDDTVVLESTVPPGTTSEFLAPKLEVSGITVSEDVAVAYSPETILPGNVVEELVTNDRLIGEISGKPSEDLIELFGSFVEGDILTTDATTAEFVKLIQNAYRDTNIAFANEAAKIAAEIAIDSREAIDLANRHPRVNILDPGPGVGGHCLPIDPLFLSEVSNETNLITTARRVNDSMCEFVRKQIESELATLERRRVAILGIAYKGNVGDTRQSPGLALARGLREAEDSVEVALEDPYVNDPTIDLTSRDQAIEEADAVVLVTDHDEYLSLDPSEFACKMNGDLVIDTRAMLDEERWTNAGLNVKRI